MILVWESIGSRQSRTRLSSPDSAEAGCGANVDPARDDGRARVCMLFDPALADNLELRAGRGDQQFFFAVAVDREPGLVGPGLHVPLDSIPGIKGLHPLPAPWAN